MLHSGAAPNNSSYPFKTQRHQIKEITETRLQTEMRRGRKSLKFDKMGHARREQWHVDVISRWNMISDLATSLELFMAKQKSFAA